MDYNSEELVSLLILFALDQKEKVKWDEYRSKAVELTDSAIKALDDYFEDMFKYNIPQYSLPPKTCLFRARQIKSNEFGQIEADIQSLNDEFLRIFLNDEDFKKLDMPDSLLTPEILAALKALGSEDWDKEQLNKLGKLNEKYSIPNLFYGFSKSGCGVPPLKNRRDGRLNTKEDAYLYLTLDKDTAIYEMRPSISQSYSIATCVSNRELLLVDLRYKQVESTADNFTVSSIVEKVSEPNTDNDSRFYHITQCLSHFLQRKGYHGIIYTSAIKQDGVNVMLFDEDNVTFTSSDIITINNITVNYTTNLPFSN